MLLFISYYINRNLYKVHILFKHMDSLDEIRALKLERKVYRLRHRDGLAWTDVAKKVSKEFKKEINSKKTQEIYDMHVSRAKSVISVKREENRNATKVNDDWVKEMREIVQKIRSKALKHLEIADELLLNEYKQGNTKAYFNNLPVAIQLFRSLLDQANSLGRRLEKIEINQNNFILNETQILQLINKKMSQREHEAGYIIHPGTGQLLIKKKKTLT